ncbi:unnamed protein product [Citrullus colocynthis]|uniref:DUF674 family protein n=1 Tax=Citrullus colocynthis TaxID=252529 RepID=A0ABP0YUY3_9ROSI
MEQTDVRLKLLIDTKTERVLFNLLSLPVGAVIRLLKKDGMVGCLGNLYESVETLNESYLQPNQSRDTVLKPKVLFNSFTKLLPNVDVSATPTPPATFCCNNSSYSSCRNQPAPGRGFVKDLATYIVMDDLTVKHISHFSITTLLKKFNIKDVDSLEEKVITLDVHDGDHGRHVGQAHVSYLYFTLFNKFKVKKVGDLEEKVVTLDINKQ